jgi:uncharacterized protein YkwD
MKGAVAVLAALVTASALGGVAHAAVEHDWVTLAFVHPHAPEIEAAQARVLFDDVNATRAEHRLPTLVHDARLDAIALDVAQQMAARHYFGHTDPNGVTFADRLHASGYRFRFAAENMAFDQDESHANAALLHSPGHYRNIVDPAARRLGTAVVGVGEGQVFFVEEFSD